MKYELAKELKDAGFLHEDWEMTTSEDTPEELVTGVTIDCYKNPPTLLELIEACGEGFSDLGTNRNQGIWFCNNECPPYVDVDWDECKTPEEAVAKLWLALNKK